MKIRKFLTVTLAASALTAGMAAPAQAQTEGSLRLSDATVQGSVNYVKAGPIAWIAGGPWTPLLLGSMGSLDFLGVCIFPDAPYLCD